MPKNKKPYNSNQSKMLSAIAEPCELWSMNLGQLPSDIDNQKVSFALECLLRLWLNYRREIYEMGAKI
jgi:hypothetical protein